MFACFIEGSGHVDRKYWQRLWSAKSVLTIRKSKAKSARQLTVWVSGSATVIERHGKNRKKRPWYLLRPLATMLPEPDNKKTSAGNATTDAKPRTRIQVYVKTTARKLYVTIPLLEMPRPLPVPVACGLCRCAAWPDMPNVQMLHMLYIGCHPMLFWNERLRFWQLWNEMLPCSPASKLFVAGDIVQYGCQFWTDWLPRFSGQDYSILSEQCTQKFSSPQLPPKVGWAMQQWATV